MGHFEGVFSWMQIQNPPKFSARAFGARNRVYMIFWLKTRQNNHHALACALDAIKINDILSYLALFLGL